VIDTIYAQNKTDLHQTSTVKSQINIAFVSCFNYQDHLKINKVFEQIIKTKQDFKVIGAGNALGSDLYIRNLALSLKKDYVEFPPKHYEHNEYCYYPKEFFSKEYYSPQNYSTRYVYILNNCDIIFIFMNDDTKDMSFHFLMQELQNKNYNIPYIIIN
jgi:uncharacterized phage-like protein YoqJ